MQPNRAPALPVEGDRRFQCTRIKTLSSNGLETTKKLGLLSDYLVSRSGWAGRLRAKVTVWGKDGMPEQVVQGYVARLLDGLVNDRQIFVAAE